MIDIRYRAYSPFKSSDVENSVNLHLDGSNQLWSMYSDCSSDDLYTLDRQNSLEADEHPFPE